MWIKICGMTDANAVAAALEARADAIGFVFAPSVRRLEPAHAAQLARAARGKITCVAVTHHPDQMLIDRILDELTPDVLQTDEEDLATLQLPASLAVLPVIRQRALRGEREFVAERPVLARFLFEGPVSGAGAPTDWRAARELARRAEVVLAGGLSPANVATAIAQVRPYGVDVSSGVEASPGRKSPMKIAEFVAAARAAALEIES
jgi:phosphoribosylanthranilate isomerase